MGKMKNIICYLYIILSICLVFSCSDYSEDLGGNYTYMNEGGSLKSISHRFPKKGGRIPPSVVSYGYNTNFIIAKQIPDSALIAMGYDREYDYDRGLCDDYYWLIIKKEQRTLGPMSIHQFNVLKKQYNIPDELKLE